MVASVSHTSHNKANKVESIILERDSGRSLANSRASLMKSRFQTKSICAKRARYPTTSICAKRARFPSTSIRAKRARFPSTSIRAKRARFPTTSIRAKRARFPTTSIRANRARLTTTKARLRKAWTSWSGTIRHVLLWRWTKRSGSTTWMIKSTVWLTR